MEFNPMSKDPGKTNEQTRAENGICGQVQQLYYCYSEDREWNWL
jgi:hypothetical protein